MAQDGEGKGGNWRQNEERGKRAQLRSNSRRVVDRSLFFYPNSRLQTHIHTHTHTRARARTHRHRRRTGQAISMQRVLQIGGHCKIIVKQQGEIVEALLHT